jgi:hypothetical protein
MRAQLWTIAVATCATPVVGTNGADDGRDELGGGVAAAQPIAKTQSFSIIRRIVPAVGPRATRTD